MRKSRRRIPAVILGMILILAMTLALPVAVFADDGSSVPTRVTEYFNVDVKVHENNSYDFTETVGTVFNTEGHGIYRYVPTEFDGISERVDSGWCSTDQLETYEEDGNYILQMGSGDSLVIGSRVDRLTHIIRQCNLVAMLLAEWVSRLVPYFAAILICMQIIANESLIKGLWKAFVLALTVSLLFLGVVLTYVSIRKEVSPGTLVRKLWIPFSKTLRAGSLEEAFGLAEKSCIKELGIESRFASVMLPQGLVLYMPINVIGTLALTVYAAARFEISVTPVWFVVAMVLAVVLFVATPPVPGANLLAYIAIFAQLGIASQTLIDAMVFDIVFGIFASAANLAMLQLELIIQADNIGLLNKERLKTML